jgi:hypothetical protein
MRFGAGDQRQDVRFVDAFEQQEVGHRRLAFGDGAGLVEHQGVSVAAVSSASPLRM